MIEYIRVVSKQRPTKRAFDMQVGAHLRVYIAGKITGDKNYREKFAKAELETPFKAYIYCTQDKHLAFMQNQTGTNLIACMDVNAAIPVGGAIGNGKVIGEFTCDRIYELAPLNHAPDDVEKQACLTREEIVNYLKGIGYGWHISDLRIYDTPKELSEFTPVCRYKNDDGSCPSRRVACSYQKYDYNPDGSIKLVECGRTFERPPQSWCYVEAMEDGN